MNRFFVPLAGVVVLICLATLLIWKIVLLSPDTHAHLWNTLHPEYDRTSPIFLGQKASSLELTLGKQQAQVGDPNSMEEGRAIYLNTGCATCHGLDARGGPVGPSLAGSSLGIVKHMVRDGPGGMPAYSEEIVSEADLGTLAAYLQGLTVVKPSTEEIATIQRITYSPSVPIDMLLKGKAALRRSCGACHSQPTREEILHAFGSDALAASLVAQMVGEANVSLEDGKAIAYYMMAILHGADMVKEP